MYVIDQPRPQPTTIPGVAHATWAGSDEGLAQLSLWRQTLAPGTLDTKGGPVTDALGRVVDVKDEVIPGLYAAGNCAASISGQSYWGAGGTLGPAITFGYLAGKDAAAPQ